LILKKVAADEIVSIGHAPTLIIDGGNPLEVVKKGRKA